jgi:hypothetical protein
MEAVTAEVVQVRLEVLVQAEAEAVMPELVAMVLSQ